MSCCPFLVFMAPKMKGANWLKLICYQGRSLVDIFSLWNIWYKSVVLFLIWLHSLVCQTRNKQMSQLVAYSSKICVWVVSCNEWGGGGGGGGEGRGVTGWCSASKDTFFHPPSPFHGNFCNCNSIGICTASRFWVQLPLLYTAWNVYSEIGPACSALWPLATFCAKDYKAHSL